MLLSFTFFIFVAYFYAKINFDRNFEKLNCSIKTILGIRKTQIYY